MTTGLLVLGHGSREPTANQQFETLVAEIRAHHPELDVVHGYVELADPLPVALQALARRCRRVVVFPLFLLAAGHVKNDLPLALAAARRDFPGVEFIAARPLGVHPNLVTMALDRARAALEPPAVAGSGKTALVVVGRGSSDPDANADFCKVVRLIGEGSEFSAVVPSFAGITGPRFVEAIEQVARARPERIVALPYLLFDGRLIARLRTDLDGFKERYPWIRTALAPSLGRDPRLLELIDERLAEAGGEARPLPCDTCHYRVPIAEVTENVGGVRALLWSLRHGFTHTQAMPHLHAHRPLTRHVLVCGNVDCAGKGSVPLLAALRRKVKEAGHELDIRITRTHCMGRCGEGPTVAVYPDGIWYRGVRESDADDLVREHLLGDRLVSRLVDNIMQ